MNFLAYAGSTNANTANRISVSGLTTHGSEVAQHMLARANVNSLQETTERNLSGYSRRGPPGLPSPSVGAHSVEQAIS